MTETHKGSCFCGSVDIALSGKPVVMGYCHCESCRHWSASPVNAFTLWPNDAVRVTRGEQYPRGTARRRAVSASGVANAAGTYSRYTHTGGSPMSMRPRYQNFRSKPVCT